MKRSSRDLTGRTEESNGDIKIAGLWTNILNEVILNTK
jgi:hypothetical protein